MNASATRSSVPRSLSEESAKHRSIIPVYAWLPLLGFGVLYLGTIIAGFHVNAIVLAITLMVLLCLIKVPVTIALTASAVLGGLHAGLGMEGTLSAFKESFTDGAHVGITYVMVGALAVALSRTGIIEHFAAWVSKKAHTEHKAASGRVVWALCAMCALVAVLSQNLVPVHIAFIPILLPPLLGVLNKLRIDRRAIACILACCMSASYLLIPAGFGAIYLNDILLANASEFGASHGLTATSSIVWKAMFWPVMGLVAGMLVAVFISYRSPREYPAPAADSLATKSHDSALPALRPFPLIMTVFAVVSVLVFQVLFDSLLIGSLIGFLLLVCSGTFRWEEQDDVFTRGIVMMAQIAMVITVASGFAGLLNATGEVEPLVAAIQYAVGGNRVLGAFLMLALGLFLTIGFGDSFASVPILAPIYIPLALALGFSPLAAISLLGASAALGDAGSPASTISLGITSGLNADGRHDHIRDTVIPTFLHCNIGMLLFAAVAALAL